MSEVNTAELKRALEAKHRELSLASSNREEIAIHITADDMDRLQLQLSRDIAIRNLDHSSKLLRSVQEALDRIEDGIFGVCLRCDEVIREKRLKAVPWASYCVSCQEMIDASLPTDFDDDLIDFAA